MKTKKRKISVKLKRKKARFEIVITDRINGVAYVHEADFVELRNETVRKMCIAGELSDVETTCRVSAWS